MSESARNIFKPPHLDKLLVVLQLLGMIHIRKATNLLSQKFKPTAFMIYNTITVCSTITLMLLTVVISVNKGSKSFVSIISGVNDLVIYFWTTVSMVIMFLLSWKSKLNYFEKPKNWIRLPVNFENRTPRRQIICYMVTVILVLCLMLAFLVSLIVLSFDSDSLIYQSCFQKGHESNISLNIQDINITKLPMVYCFTTSMFIFNVPSFFATFIVPVYLSMWINYCSQLLRGINFELKNISYGNSLHLKKSRCQYWAVCHLVDEINTHFGSLIATYVFTAIFIIFLNGYLVTKSAFSGSSLSSANVAMYLATVTIVVYLFYSSCQLKNQVSASVS